METIATFIGVIVALLIVAFCERPTKPIKKKEKYYRLNVREDVTEKVRSKYNLDSALNKDCVKFLEEEMNRRIDLVNIVFDDLDSKDKQIFHGACLSCKQPQDVGVRVCRTCCYFTMDWDLSDKSKILSQNT